MKLLVTTRADDNIKWYTDFTHPCLQSFAKKWGADFKILPTESPCDSGDGKYHYRIVEIKKFLEDYDRVLHLDSDILILPSCPNLFEEIPKDRIGTIFEDKGSREHARHMTMMEAQAKLGYIGWRHNYINTGVFMVSKEHSGIFDPVDGDYWEGIGWDDIHFGYQAHRLGLKIHELPYIFNHMTMFSEPWNGEPDRFNSHIIHYAGAGVFDAGPKITQMKNDYIKVYGEV